MNEMERNFKEVTALFNRKPSVEQANPQEIKVIDSYVGNPKKLTDQAMVAGNAISYHLRTKGDSLEEKDRKSFLSKANSAVDEFKRVIEVFKDHGLWPAYDGARFRNTQDQVSSISKLAADNDYTEKALPKFLELLPSILKKAIADLSEDKDKSYLPGLYRIVFDSLFDKDGLITNIEGLAKEYGDTPPVSELGKTKPKKALSPEQKFKQVKWLGTKGITSISKSLGAIVAKRRPKEIGPQRAQFDKIITEATKKVVANDWSNRLKSALEDYGFHADGSFDKVKFENRFNRFADLAKLAAEEEVVSSFPELKKEFMGTYKAFESGVAEFSDDPVWKDNVINKYFELVLDGKDNLYKALKDLHGTISEQTVAIPEETKVEPEDKALEGKKKPGTEDSKEDSADTEPGNKSTGPLGTLSPNDDGYVENTGDSFKYSKNDLANEIRRAGSYVKGFLSYNDKGFSVNDNVASSKDVNGMTEGDRRAKALCEALERAGLAFSKDLIKTPGVLEILINSAQSRNGKFRDAVETAIKANPFDLKTAFNMTKPAAERLLGWTEALYADFLSSAKVVIDTTFKKKKKKEKTEPPFQKVTPEKAEEILEDITEKSKKGEPINSETVKDLGGVVQESPEVIIEGLEVGGLKTLSDVASRLVKLIDSLSRINDDEKAGDLTARYMTDLTLALTKLNGEPSNLVGLVTLALNKFKGSILSNKAQKKPFTVLKLQKSVDELLNTVNSLLKGVEESVSAVADSGKSLEENAGADKEPDFIDQLNGHVDHAEGVVNEAKTETQAVAKALAMMEDPDVDFDEGKETSKGISLEDSTEQEEEKIPEEETKEETPEEKSPEEESPEETPEDNNSEEDLDGKKIPVTKKEAGPNLVKALTSLVKGSRGSKPYAAVREELGEFLRNIEQNSGLREFFLTNGLLEEAGLGAVTKELTKAAIEFKATNVEPLHEAISPFFRGLMKYYNSSELGSKDTNLISDIYYLLNNALDEAMATGKTTGAVKTASNGASSGTDKVLSVHKVVADFEKKAAINKFTIRIKGFNNSVDVPDLSEGKIKWALGRILSRDYSRPDLQRQVLSYYNAGAFTREPYKPYQPKPDSFRDRYKPSMGKKPKPGSNPLQQDLFGGK